MSEASVMNPVERFVMRVKVAMSGGIQSALIVAVNYAQKGRINHLIR